MCFSEKKKVTDTFMRVRLEPTISCLSSPLPDRLRRSGLLIDITDMKTTIGFKVTYIDGGTDLLTYNSFKTTQLNKLQSSFVFRSRLLLVLRRAWG